MKFSKAFITKSQVSSEDTRTYTITGKVNQLDNLESLFAWIQKLGGEGHSGSAQLFVDGDGAARLRFEVDGKEIKINDKHWVNENKEPPANGPEFKVGLD